MANKLYSVFIFVGLVLGLMGPTSTVLADQWNFWKLPAQNTNHLDRIAGLRPFHFTNRAACAADSKKPADSFYVMVNNMDLGRSLYRLGERTNRDPKQLSEMGIQVFRYSVIQLTQHIHGLIAQKKLPLLPSTLKGSSVPQKYAEIMKSCNSSEVCRPLDEYLATLWQVAQDAGNANVKGQLSSLDNFQSRHFLNPNTFEQKDGAAEALSCHYLKKFSPIQASLYGTKPTQDVMGQMAQALIKNDQYLAECNDVKAQTHLGLAGFQLELPIKDEDQWESQGMDYWNSMRLYFTWAWRNAQSLNQMFHPFESLFRGIAIEEAVMFVPHGCRSIAPPQCDSSYLGQNVIREFAKQDYRKKANRDLFAEMPAGPQWDMIEKPLTEINNDILNLAFHENAVSWLDNFQKNYTITRGLMKKKLIKSVSTLNMIMGKLSAEELNQLVVNYFAPVIKATELNAAPTPQEARLRQELYYLCSEYYFSHHQEFHLIREDLALVGKTPLVDSLAFGMAQHSGDQYFNYFDVLGKQVVGLCDKLNQRQVWDENFSLKREGFAPWYLEKVYQGKYQSQYQQEVKSYIESNLPLLSYAQFQDKKQVEDVICASPSHCAREVLVSIAELYSVTVYASTFWNLDQKAPAPSMFNPYGERVACGVYDPWFKTRATLFNFFTNMSQAALSTVAPGLIYTSFELEPGRVTSFKRLVEEGKIAYKPKGNPERINAAVLADFGPLLGVPCTVSISNTEHHNINYYQFAGISVSACQGTQRYNLNVASAEELQNSRDRTHSECFSCALNFEGVARSLTHFASQVNPVFFMVRGLIKLFQGFQDPNDIPHEWSIDPDLLLETYRRYGEIPKRCVPSLRAGKLCLENKCEENVVTLVKQQLRGQVLGTLMPHIRNSASVQLDSCKEPIRVALVKNRADETTCVVNQVIVPAGCEGIKR